MGGDGIAGGSTREMRQVHPSSAGRQDLGEKLVCTAIDVDEDVIYIELRVKPARARLWRDRYVVRPLSLALSSHHLCSLSSRILHPGNQRL